MEAIIDKIINNVNININPKFINFSKEEYLATGFLEFFIILQSCPTYTTIPIIHFVFFNLAPLNSNCFAFKEIICSFSDLSNFIFIILLNKNKS